MFNFLWDNKPDKIKRKTIIQDFKMGGLKMFDIQKNHLFFKGRLDT